MVGRRVVGGRVVGGRVVGGRVVAGGAVVDEAVVVGAVVTEVDDAAAVGTVVLETVVVGAAVVADAVVGGVGVVGAVDGGGLVARVVTPSTVGSVVVSKEASDSRPRIVSNTEPEKAATKRMASATVTRCPTGVRRLAEGKAAAMLRWRAMVAGSLIATERMELTLPPAAAEGLPTMVTAGTGRPNTLPATTSSIALDTLRSWASLGIAASSCCTVGESIANKASASDIASSSPKACLSAVSRFFDSFDMW